VAHGSIECRHRPVVSLLMYRLKLVCAPLASHRRWQATGGPSPCGARDRIEAKREPSVWASIKFKKLVVDVALQLISLHTYSYTSKWTSRTPLAHSFFEWI
jgi:hypothetical protein